MNYLLYSYSFSAEWLASCDEKDFKGLQFLLDTLSEWADDGTLKLILRASEETI